VTDFSVLAPDLDTPHRRMLKVMLQKAGMVTAGLPIVDTLAECPTRHVLSVGKSGLDTWHDFGLIQVGAHHGNVFSHWTPPTATSSAGHRVIMVVHHPGTLMQLTITGYEAKDQMGFDLMRWRGLLDGRVAREACRQTTCGKCLSRRGKGGPVHRPAEHWVVELDGCGLCEDCYRTRGKIVRREKKKRVNPSSREAQIQGQLEMLPGDGTRVVVAKG
jgi:hypothetical protein